MLAQEGELKLAEKRTRGYLFSTVLSLGIAAFALFSFRINLFGAYTSYLNGAAIIFGVTGLVDIGFYLFAKREYLKQKGISNNINGNSSLRAL